MHNILIKIKDTFVKTAVLFVTLEKSSDNLNFKSSFLDIHNMTKYCLLQRRVNNFVLSNLV